MKSLEETHFFHTAPRPVKLMSSPWDPSRPACELAPGARYEITSEPSFVGEYVKVRFSGEDPACPMRGGFMLMPDVKATSAGGIWELPGTVRAFLDTIAYAEGTKWRYNYIFTFATFESYASHPDRRICAGRLCSTAAGRYQFLTSTWKGLASSLRLEDFSPPSQDKACLEIIRRAGAYGLVLNSGKYENFAAAMKKLNRTWASLPGSPYGQPTHTTSELWKVYNGALSR
ncbi:MAG: glycoside hydrolase family 104 protein [Elusimicrobiales bacterium]